MNRRTRGLYLDLTIRLRQDEDDDVRATPEGLQVHGHLFAFIDGEALAVRLSPARGHDLVTRGQAEHHSDGNGWVTVVDTELWNELADESHAYVGEPAVGGQS